AAGPGEEAILGTPFPLNQTARRQGSLPCLQRSPRCCSKTSARAFTRGACHAMQSSFASRSVDVAPIGSYTGQRSRKETMDTKSRLGVVIGGGNGIGAACCKVMAQRGWRLAVVDLERQRAEAVAKE